MSDLDDDELKATREHNGASRSNPTSTDEDKFIKLQNEANKKIEDIVAEINKACEGLSNIQFLEHVMIVGYVDVGVAKGFVSSNYNLKHLESQTTYLLDFLSKSIKEGVRTKAKEKVEDIKNIIEKENEESE